MFPAIDFDDLHLVHETEFSRLLRRTTPHPSPDPVADDPFFEFCGRCPTEDPILPYGPVYMPWAHQGLFGVDRVIGRGIVTYAYGGV